MAGVGELDGVAVDGSRRDEDREGEIAVDIRTGEVGNGQAVGRADEDTVVVEDSHVELVLVSDPAHVLLILRYMQTAGAWVVAGCSWLRGMGSGIGKDRRACCSGSRFGFVCGNSKAAGVSSERTDAVRRLGKDCNGGKSSIVVRGNSNDQTGSGKGEASHGNGGGEGNDHLHVRGLSDFFECGNAVRRCVQNVAMLISMRSYAVPEEVSGVGDSCVDDKDIREELKTGCLAPFFIYSFFFP